MDYVLYYFAVGYFVSLLFCLMVWFSLVEEKFTARDCIWVMIFWPFAVFNFIKELINHNNGR
jgi:hypothetical protein